MILSPRSGCQYAIGRMRIGQLARQAALAPVIASDRIIPSLFIGNIPTLRPVFDGYTYEISNVLGEDELRSSEKRFIAMTFVSGQQVIWRYRPLHTQKTLLVAAEVVQYGQLRTRIRIYTPNNTALFRWVHPKNLCLKGANEQACPYPVSE